MVIFANLINDDRVATLPGNLEFDILGKKNVEKPGIFNNFYLLSTKILILHKKFIM